MGQESNCEMLALKEVQPDGRPAVYSRCSVIKASAGMPDGEYTVSFEGNTVWTRREGGLWLADGSSLNDAA